MLFVNNAQRHVVSGAAMVLSLAITWAAWGQSAGQGPTSAPAGPTGPVLHKGDLLAIAGDSITEFQGYSCFIEEYLTACRPDLKIRCVQLGWSGDWARGFDERFERDVLPFKPDVMTTCFGMNDGFYRPLDEPTRLQYAKCTQSFVAKAKKAGIRLVLGGPGVVDPSTFRNPNIDGAGYNVVLGKLSDTAKEVAVAEGLSPKRFADVHTPMLKAMTAAKAALGKDYPIAPDGIHPGPNGHLVMAIAFLKALGMDGDIGTITIDMTGKASATDGHKILSANNGVVEVQSTRYPFCMVGNLFGNDKRPDSVSSILPLVPFDQDLNRLNLVVRNLSSPKAKVTWGKTSKVFTKEQLANGVNLAAEFRGLGENPFSENFAKIDQFVFRKQTYERFLVKNIFVGLEGMQKCASPDTAADKEDQQVRNKLVARQQAMQDELAKLVTPVKHTIKIEPQ